MKFEQALSRLAVCIVLAVVSQPARAAERALELVGCPTLITVQLDGMWSASRYDDQVVSEMQGNPARTSTIAGVFVREDGASIVVASLASLTKVQGKITPEIFSQLRDMFTTQATASREEIRRRVEERSVAGGYQEGDFLLQPTVTLNESAFYTPGLSERTASDGTPFRAFIGGTMHLVHGCIATATISLPAGTYTPSQVDAAVRSVRFR